jgi:hypothetical protein
MTLIKLGDRLFNSETIAVIKPIDDDQCVIFTVGQSALDEGFLVDLPMEEIEDLLSEVDRTILLDLAERIGGEIEKGEEDDEDEEEEEEDEDEIHAMDRSSRHRTRG